MAAEDFASTHKKKSRLLLSIGSREYRKRFYFWLHSPTFNIDESALETGRWF